MLIQSSDRPMTFIIIGVGPSDLSGYSTLNRYQSFTHSDSGKTAIR